MDMFPKEKGPFRKKMSSSNHWCLGDILVFGEFIAACPHHTAKCLEKPCDTLRGCLSFVNTLLAEWSVRLVRAKTSRLFTQPSTIGASRGKNAGSCKEEQTWSISFCTDETAAWAQRAKGKHPIILANSIDIHKAQKLPCLHPTPLVPIHDLLSVWWTNQAPPPSRSFKWNSWSKRLREVAVLWMHWLLFFRLFYNLQFFWFSTAQAANLSLGTWRYGKGKSAEWARSKSSIFQMNQWNLWEMNQSLPMLDPKAPPTKRIGPSWGFWAVLTTILPSSVFS